MPNLFLTAFGTNGVRPIWFVMLLAAMASSAIWFVALTAITHTSPLTLQGYSTFQNIFGCVFLWSEATVWFHLVYLVQVHLNNDAERQVEVWASPIGMLIMFFVKAGWIIIKYVAAPMIPIVLVSELGDILGIGDVLFDIASILFLLYPVCGIAVYLVQRRRMTARSRTSVKSADVD